MRVPIAHGAYSGPLDAFVDVGLPLLALVVLWLLSRRKGPKRKEAERRRAAGDPEFYRALPTDDLATLIGMLEARTDRGGEDERTLAGARADLKARRGRPAVKARPRT